MIICSKIQTFSDDIVVAVVDAVAVVVAVKVLVELDVGIGLWYEWHFDRRLFYW